MSYSFNVRGATVAAAVAAVSSRFDEVADTQRVHLKDRDAAVGAATAIAGLLSEPEQGQEVSISVSGYLQWRAGDGVIEPHQFTGANVSVQAAIVATTE